MFFGTTEKQEDEKMKKKLEQKHHQMSCKIVQEFSQIPVNLSDFKWNSKFLLSVRVSLAVDI